jgi:hypothetical protein
MYYSTNLTIIILNIGTQFHLCNYYAAIYTYFKPLKKNVAFVALHQNSVTSRLHDKCYQFSMTVDTKLADKIKRKMREGRFTQQACMRMGLNFEIHGFT